MCHESQIHKSWAVMSHLINVTIPVFNEELVLAPNIQRLTSFLEGHFADQYELIIADNGSTDGTLPIARELERQYRSIRVLHIDQKGRGRALKKAWMESYADILSYMDVDLSTNIEFFPSLILPISSGAADICVGSRLLKSSATVRSIRREIISRCYNRLVKLLFRATFSDAQCGFKALSRPLADMLLPLVKDDGWFFDTELLLLSERMRYRICDLPVEWTEGRDSRVKIVNTAIKDLKGLWRLRRDFK
jgi:glycosyltransferase involved in cell wall biosynthesis